MIQSETIVLFGDCSELSQIMQKSACCIQKLTSLLSYHSISLSMYICHRDSQETYIEEIVTGTVFAMDYLHLRRFVHSNPKPEAFFVDWDWIV
jgi:serine/threonine protein kinase